MHGDRMSSGILIDREPRPDFGPNFSAGSTRAYAWRGDGASSCGCGCGECTGDCGCGAAPFAHWDVVADGWESSLMQESGASSIGDQHGCGLSCGGRGQGSPPPAPPLPEGEDPLPPRLTNDWQWDPLGEVHIARPPWHGGDIIPFPDEPRGIPFYGCPAAITFGQADTSERVVLQSRVLTPAPNAVWSPRLIVFLPGRNGDPGPHDVILRAYRAAGFRTIGLRWNQITHATTRVECQIALAAQGIVDDVAFNGCLQATRNSKFLALSGRLLAILQLLDLASPMEGWADYLTVGQSDIDWSQIVIAGYSEGAQEAAYITRRVAAFGAIFVSGGGDAANQTGDAMEDNLAAWMFSPVFTYPGRIVGIRHDGESADYTDGWDLDGITPNIADAAATPAEAYGVFGGAHRLVSYSLVAGPDEAHSNTYDDPDLFPAHMYLACAAGSL